MNKEYLFYVQTESVLNCSRTREYQSTPDVELLDLKFRNIGDKEKIESEMLTARELEFLTPRLDNRNLTPENIPTTSLHFAIDHERVSKWNFLNMFDELGNWAEAEFKLEQLELKNGSKVWVLWAGKNWKKSVRQLRRKLLD